MDKCLDENYCDDFKERAAIDMGDSSEESENISEERARIRARWEICDKCKEKRECAGLFSSAANPERRSFWKIIPM